MTTTTVTVGEIITDALRKIGVVSIDEELQPDEANAAMRELNRMLKGWQNKKYLQWTYSRMSVPAIASDEYTLNPVRPIRISEIRLRRNGIDTPMYSMTRDEYDTLPQKQSRGLPTTYYYDKQAIDARLHVWPVLSAVHGETLEITYERELADITATTDVLDAPSEWWDAVTYCLADRMMDEYDKSMERITARAIDLLGEAMGADLEETIVFGENA